MGGKWLELLKEIEPGVKRAAFIFNPDTAPGGGSFFFGSFEAAAQSFGVKPIKAAVRSDTDIETIIAGLGREPGRRTRRLAGRFHVGSSRIHHFAGGP